MSERFIYFNVLCRGRLKSYRDTVWGLSPPHNKTAEGMLIKCWLFTSMISTSSDNSYSVLSLCWNVGLWKCNMEDHVSSNKAHYINYAVSSSGLWCRRTQQFHWLKSDWLELTIMYLHVKRPLSFIGLSLKDVQLLEWLHCNCGK